MQALASYEWIDQRVVQRSTTLRSRVTLHFRSKDGEKAKQTMRSIVITAVLLVPCWSGGAFGQSDQAYGDEAYVDVIERSDRLHREKRDIGTAASAQVMPEVQVPPPILDGGPVVIPPSAVARARFVFEEALRTYNGRKVRTAKERDYVLGLRNAYITEYKRLFSPPPQYDRPYTGTLTIERVADSAALQVHCPELKDHAGCAKVAKDRSWCKVYIVSDEDINRRSAEERKLFGYSYANFLRHELAHCNGWPGDHPH